MEREACVCDHGLEISDLCAEIIIIITSYVFSFRMVFLLEGSTRFFTDKRNQLNTRLRKTYDVATLTPLPPLLYFSTTYALVRGDYYLLQIFYFHF